MTDAKAYKWDAEDYRKNSRAQYEWARELIDKLCLVGRESVLDIGCGDGKVTAAIASRVPEGGVVGIDNSESMISKARAMHSGDRYANVRFQLADVLTMDFEEEFDVVFSNAALHWVKDQRKVLERSWRSLKRGGREAVEKVWHCWLVQQ